MRFLLSPCLARQTMGMATILEKKVTPLRVTVPILGAESDGWVRPDPPEVWSDPRRVRDLFTVEFSQTARDALAGAVQQGGWAPWADRALALDALQFTFWPDSAGADLCVLRRCRERFDRAGVVLYPHQLETVRRVIGELDGRAVLADEVGLGKTIEAAMIIQEYILRGEARRILILTPASLCWQWYWELRHKFGLAAGLTRSEHDWERGHILIASLDTAKRSPHAGIIHSLPYDLLVVDEAHRLKNPTTHNWQFVNRIIKRRCLLLTATPVQNDLRELFSLVSLLRPTLLGTYTEFRRRFMADKRTVRKPDELRRALSGVMIRHRRGTGTVSFTRRQVAIVPITFTEPEQALHTAIRAYVQQAYARRKEQPKNLLPLVTLLREACSTAFAAALTLDAMLERARGEVEQTALTRLLDLAARVRTSAKVDALLAHLEAAGEQTIVFTEYRASAAYIIHRLEKAGLRTLAFDGSLGPGKKEWVRELFRRQGDVLVSTEAGGEGLNFQFCRRVVNFDLPWNPMRLEQRIGRVHRLGQTRDVVITNLVTRQSIEEFIVYLLHEKIDMFRSAIGELDMIIQRLGGEGALATQLFHAVLSSDDPAAAQARLDRLGAEFTRVQAELARGDGEWLP